MTYVLTLLFILACLTLLHLDWLRRFCLLFKRSRYPTQVTRIEKLPHAVVVLSLRGFDPSLPNCLRGLLNQTYPSYEVRIVVDSRHDPAWKVVADTISGHEGPAVHVEPLEMRLDSCSLKLSALVQELSDLDSSHEVVVLLDADAVPSDTWLEDLLAPLKSPDVGAVSGFRWFMPTSGNWGSVIRSLWNAASVSQMVFFEIPWGGSLAIKTDVLRRTNLLSQWKRSLTEDLQVEAALREIGLKFEHAPVLMVNTEVTDLRGCFRFIRRQMLWIRLYHKCWPIVVSYVFGNAIIGILAAGLCLSAWAAGDITAAILSGVSLASYLVVLTAAALWMERVARCVVQARHQTPDVLTWQTYAACVPTLLLSAASVFSAACISRIEWRGIVYHFNGPWQVRMLNDEPYVARVEAADVSIV